MTFGQGYAFLYALNGTLKDESALAGELPENLREAAGVPSSEEVEQGLDAKLDKAQNLADLTDSGAARDNLGLGTAALNDEEDFAAANHTHSDATTSAAGFMSAADKVKLDAIEAGADVTDAGNVGSAIHGADAKTTPVDADTVALIDSAASNALKKLSWSNIKATLKSYFDTLYAAASHSHSDATTSAAGFMSAADKTKLDGIEAGADVTNKDNVEAALNDAEAKSTPVDADALALLDSEDDDKLKLVTISDLKSVIGGGSGSGDMEASVYDPTGKEADAFDRANHHGTIAASDVSGLANVATTGKFEDVTDTPTTLAGYGITDAYTKTEVDSALLGHEFIASGSIGNNKFVALRSDGKVEVVTGTGSPAALGPDNSQITVSDLFAVLDAKYNATAGKVAIVYVNFGATITLYIRIGTVSGQTINFGSATTIASGNTGLNAAKVCWNADGTRVVAVYLDSNFYPNLRAGSVSGSSVSLGTAATIVSSSAQIVDLVHDDVHGSRVVAIDSGGAIAATYSGSPPTLSLGARSTNFTVTGSSGRVGRYDAANSRYILSGDNGTNIYVRALTVSGTIVSAGSEINFAGRMHGAELDVSTGNLVIFYRTAASSPVQGCVITFSGSTATAGSANTITGFRATSVGGTAIREPTSGKIVLITGSQVGDSVTLTNALAVICSVSGTTITVDNVVPVAAGIVTVTNVGLVSDGVAVAIQSEADFSRVRVYILKPVGGEFRVVDDVLVKSIPRSTLSSVGLSMISDGRFFSFGAWATTTTTVTSFVLQLPSESTNADQWIGYAETGATDGNPVRVTLRGGVADGLSGLTPGAVYHLDADGSLTTEDIGRPVGTAISATELFLEAA